ncbi:MAG: hypothetical protein DRJ49_04425 [Thermoprotei archaeon]|nr:MAG: hypothetical protein DRJ49_04425 [Thermoprotei archaeon]
MNVRTIYKVSFILLILVALAPLFHVEYNYKRGIIDMIEHYVTITTGKRIKVSGRLMEKVYTLRKGRAIDV